MTIEEAIKELREASDSEVKYGDKEHHYNEVLKRIEAFELAIKTLEQMQELKSVISAETTWITDEDSCDWRVVLREDIDEVFGKGWDTE